jgi:ABC-type Na+ efflux pump permease subunit
MNSSGASLIRNIFAKILTVIFFGLAVVMVLTLLFQIGEGVLNQENITEVFLRSINTGVIALAVFELALIINKEYSGPTNNEQKNAVATLRETLPRFIGTVCVALSLEGLIMVIKYSQLDLAGNLYYPVAIIISTAFLLSALGLFIHLTDKRN